MIRESSTFRRPFYLRMSSFLTASLTAGTLLFMMACSNVESSQGDLLFKIVNDSDMDRTDETVVISRGELTRKTGPAPEGSVPVLINEQGEPLPSQLDDTNRDGDWDELAFLIDIPSRSTLELKVIYVERADYPEFPIRTNVRLGVKNISEIEPVSSLELTADELPVPLLERFQMDGPAWENDKVGFRQYIDGRNGRDLFGKTTESMALENVGISDDGSLVDNYHVLEPWGRDILAVGTSLGIGGTAIMYNGIPVRLGITPDAPRNNVEITRYQLISEGPVRSVFVLSYEGWKVGDMSCNLENTVEIRAGKYRHLNTLQLQNCGQADTLVAGLVNIHNDEPLIVTGADNVQWIGLATHDRQTYDKEHFLGMALILPAEAYAGYETAPESGSGITRSYNALLNVGNGEPVTYHVLAVWELSDSSFTERQYFEQFLMNEIEQLSNPVTIQ